MTHANQFKTKGAHGAVVLAAAAVLGTGALGALPLGCSTEDEIIFSTKCVAGRCNEDPAGGTSGATSSATSGGSGAATDCPDKDVVDQNCPSWKDNIFIPIIDKGAAGNCADASCHGNSSATEPVLVPGDAKATRDALLKFKMNDPPEWYVSCGTPQNSKILCNLLTVNGCGIVMPKGLPKLDQTQIDLIAEWIKCGAPDN